MQREFEVEGYTPEKLLGFGPTGQVWQARADATGDPVALKRLRPEAMAVVSRLRRDAELVHTVGGRHVAAPIDVLVTDRDVILVMEYAAGGSLAALLERRRRLEPAEAVTVFAPLAQVLAELHRRDALHGDMTPTNVLFAAGGRPLLADTGVALALDSPLSAIEEIADFLEPAVLIGDPPRPAGDVYSLAAVAFTALAGQPPRVGRDRLAGFCPDAPPSLIEVIEASINANADRRATAAEFAAELIAACPAEPVRLQGGATPRPKPAAPRAGPEPPRQRPRQSPPPRRTGRLTTAAAASEPPRRRSAMAKLAAAGILAFAFAVAAGAGWARLRAPGNSSAAPPHPAATATTAPAVFSPPHTRRPTATATPTVPGTSATVAWRGVVGYLEATRVEAFATGRAALLATVYTPDAPGLAVDEASVRSLVGRGLHAAGFTATVERVTVLTTTAQTVVLTVVDRLSSYRLVNGSGTTVGTGAARPARAFTMKLAKTPNGWRIAAILP